jgi:hypothetical protein
VGKAAEILVTHRHMVPALECVTFILHAIYCSFTHARTRPHSYNAINDIVGCSIFILNLFSRHEMSCLSNFISYKTMYTKEIHLEGYLLDIILNM